MNRRPFRRVPYAGASISANMIKPLRTAILLLGGVAALWLATRPACAQPPPLPPGVTPPSTEPPIVEELAPPVIINGKRADELNDDELTEFLQEKIRTIYVEDGQVQLIRVAPSYPLSIIFEEPVVSVLVGDTSAINVETLNPRTLVLKPLVRKGDIPLQVFFAGNKIRVFHVFITETFLDGETAIRVAGFGKNSPMRSLGWLQGGSGSSKLDIRTITQIIRNYDTLAAEKAINSRIVKRTEIFRHSKVTSFTTYYLYQFASGPAAVSFAYANPYPYPVRYDESRLRIAIGNVRYLPDYVSLHRTTLGPGQTTTGFAVIAKPAFSFKQPFELIWK